MASSAPVFDWGGAGYQFHRWLFNRKNFTAFHPQLELHSLGSVPIDDSNHTIHCQHLLRPSWLQTGGDGRSHQWGVATFIRKMMAGTQLPSAACTLILSIPRATLWRSMVRAIEGRASLASAFRLLAAEHGGNICVRFLYTVVCFDNLVLNSCN
jgi:hypothetical protein